MPSVSAPASCCSPAAVSAPRARSMSSGHARAFPPDWRTSFLRSRDASRALRAPFRPLLTKELWQIAGGRALWTMLLLLCPLICYRFVQGVSLYGEASRAASQSPALASGLSPLDGVLVP